MAEIAYLAKAVVGKYENILFESSFTLFLGKSNLIYWTQGYYKSHTINHKNIHPKYGKN